VAETPELIQGSLPAGIARRTEVMHLKYETSATK
jgi:hypothetical protein